MGVRCSQGISFIHQHKQLHRDIKPGNILMTNSGVVKIADFGIAKQLESTMSFAKTSCGTKVYLAPERFKIEARVRVIVALMWGCSALPGVCGAARMHVQCAGRTYSPARVLVPLRQCGSSPCIVDMCAASVV